MSEDNWTFGLRDKLHMLNHRQTIATFQRNISQQHWLLDPACCARLASCCYMLRPAGCCWLKFENGQIFHATFVDVAWCCSRLARFVQQCYARARAHVLFSTRNMSQHVATGWLKTRNILAPNVVAICCVLRSFGPAFRLKKLTEYMKKMKEKKRKERWNNNNNESNNSSNNNDNNFISCIAQNL